MSESRSIVYDFDGTITDSHEEVRPAMERLQDYLVGVLGTNRHALMVGWSGIEARLKADHVNWGIRKYEGNPSIVTAPLCASIYEFYVTLITLLLFGMKDDSYFSGKILTYYATYGFFPPRVDLPTAQHIANFLVRTFLNERPLPEQTVFRDGMEDHFALVSDRGYDVLIASNSPERVIRGKISTRGRLARLIASMEASGKLKISGELGKDRVDPVWNRKVDFPPPAGHWQRRDDTTLPERIRLDGSLPGRPVYLGRRRYAEALMGSSFCRAERRFAFGDTVESDLFIPHFMGAEVGLTHHRLNPLPEIDWVENNQGARMIFSAEEMSAMVEGERFAVTEGFGCPFTAGRSRG